MPIDYKKDYYSLLQVPADASAERIKQAYRRLAHKFHPDKHSGDALASLIFMDIAEAYAILSDAGQRKDYDLQTGAGILNKKTTYTTESQIDFICNEAARLKTITSQSDPYRLNKDALMYNLCALLTNEHIYTLQQLKPSKLMEDLVDNLLYCTAFLAAKDVEVIGNKLLYFTEGNNRLQATIHLFLKEQQQKQLWERYKVPVALALALLFCVLAYYISNYNHS